MIKKTVTYTTFDDETITEEFYFHFNKVELTELQMSVDGGYLKMLERVLGSKDERTIMKVIKEFVLKAYGEKTLDGKRFDKSDEISNKFLHSAAFPVIFEEITASADAITAFIKGTFPANTVDTSALKPAT